MAIAFDAKTDATVGSSVTSLTFAHTCTGSNRALLVAWSGNIADVSGVTYAGVAMTQIQTGTNVADGDQLLYGLLNPASGSNNVVISFNTTTTVVAEAASYTGVKQSANFSNKTVANVTAGTSITGTLTVAVNNSWLAAFVRNNTSNNVAGANTTIRTTANSRSMIDTNSAQATGSRSMTVTYTVGNACMLITEMEPFVAVTNSGVAAFF